MVNLKKIDDEKYVSNLFRSLGRQKGIHASVHCIDGKIFNGVFIADRKGINLEIILEKRGIILQTGEKIEISFFNRETYFLFETVIEEFSKDKYKIRRPEMVFSSVKRLISRYKIKEDEEAYVCFPKDKKKHRLVDVSTTGLSFTSEQSIFSKGEIVRNIIIKFTDRPEICIDIDVRHCRWGKNGMYTFGVSFRDMEWMVYQELFTSIFKKKYPNVVSLDEFPVNDIYDLYNSSGYLDLKPKDEMQIYFNNMTKNIQKIRNKPQITSSLLYYKDGKMLSSGAVLRIYDRTFIGHHLASTPNARFNMKAKLDIYLGLADYMLSHLYFEYYLTYIMADSLWHTEMYKRFDECINDKSKMLYETIPFFEFNQQHFKDNGVCGAYCCEIVDKPTEFLQYCKNHMEALEANCFSYSEENFNLSEIKQAYEMLGLYVARRLWKVEKNGETVAYAVAETYTDGLNLFNLLNACRIYFTNVECDKKSVLSVLLPDAAVFFNKYKKNRFNVIFKIPEKEFKEVEMPGFKFSFLAGRVMANREGGAEYRNLLLANSR